MKIPFTKAHGAKNDFLLTWRARCAPVGSRLESPAPFATGIPAWARTAGCWWSRTRRWRLHPAL